ncbi:MAG: hypothetical protein HOV80_14450 [Polyangiaceae bacterium]|nr:hypothetical protein [Polyangiaceae bacterium]
MSQKTAFESAWRPEDERLLARLEDEAAIEVLWRAQAPAGSAPPPASAAALAAATRDLSGGVDAVRAAASGDPSMLMTRLLVDRYAGLSGPFMHGSAVYFERLAEAWGTAALTASDRASADEAAVLAATRSMAAWLALAEERSYLAKLGRTLAHGARPEEAEAMAHEAALRFLNDLRSAAQNGARQLTSPSSRALASLGRIQGACNLAGLEASISRKHVSRADSSRAACIDAALAPLLDEVGDLKAREDGGEQARPTFERVRAVWEWSGRDESVEHFAVDNVTDLAWQIYKKAAWDKLRVLLEPCVPLFESLEARILRDPIGHVAYAADCAQMFVFLSESETDRMREWQNAERALRLCPSHRNGRLVMAHLCCHRAITLADQTTLFTARNDLTEAARLVERAEAMYPQSKSLSDAKKRVNEARVRWGVG